MCVFNNWRLGCFNICLILCASEKNLSKLRQAVSVTIMVIRVKFHRPPCYMEESRYTDVWHESMMVVTMTDSFKISLLSALWGETLLVGFELIAHLLAKLYICFVILLLFTILLLRLFPGKIQWNSNNITFRVYKLLY